MVLKIPPPPFVTSPDLQSLNRWLLEVTAILTAQGEINPTVVQGLPDAYTQIGDNSTDITTLFGVVTAQAATINALNNALTALSIRVFALEARAQVFTGSGAPGAGLGSVGDWYGDPTGLAGSRIWIKTAPATWTAFPF